MNRVEEFLAGIDQRWRPREESKIPLRIIGCSALMLQADYDRGTRDSDVLETRSITSAVERRLLELAGRGTELHKKHRLYMEFVKQGIPFLPHAPKFHSAAALKGLKSFRIEALDIVDVVVSKLKRFSPNDRQDIQEMAARGSVAHKVLLERFRSAVDWWAMDARAAKLPKILENLNRVERDFLRVPPSRIELPESG